LGGGGAPGGGGSAGRGGGSNGGAPSGGASNGSAGGGNSGGCNIAPANPKATQQAKNLLCYLYSQYGNHVLSGQQETSWSNPANDISWYSSNGMKLPAVLGGDYLYPSGTTQRAIAYWQAGGITMIRYHMGAPPNADSYENSMGSANIDNVLKEGTAENTSFKSKLDYAAKELQQLQAANAAVIWAPFHEVQPNGWFWWSKGTGAQFVSLWKYMFNYLTTTKGLNNLIWLTPFSGSPNSGYYPGKAYLDLSGPDTYGTNQPFTGLYSQAKGVIGSTVPIPLHETGMIPDPSKMFPTAAPWLLFNIWAGYQSDGQHNTTANIKTVYADSHTVTRDELPSLK
jgi:Glycosyl hydrolase family 26